MIGVRRPHPQQNVMSPPDIANLAVLADFNPIKSEKRLLIPFTEDRSLPPVKSPPEMKAVGLGRIDFRS
jgi:hypothetical protein